MDEYTYIHQCQMNVLDEGFTTGKYFRQYLSAESYSSYPAFNTKNEITTTTPFRDSSVEECQNSFERPPKQTKANSWDSGLTEHVSPKLPSSSSHILSFETSNSLQACPKRFHGKLDYSLQPKDEVVSQFDTHVPSISKGSVENQYCAPKGTRGTKRTYSTTGTQSNAQDHIMAERKRREKLSQRFIALSAIVPGLKKVSVIFS